ncbi:MAG: hypothetical protein II662_04490, partial [Bacteroidales bacterium]|nr:hypothetical protein [Bacteroidales bacterium]
SAKPAAGAKNVLINDAKTTERIFQIISFHRCHFELVEKSPPFEYFQINCMPVISPFRFASVEMTL